MKGMTVKKLLLATALIATFASGCADMRERFADATAYSGASSQTDGTNSRSAQSPYPSQSEGIF